MTFLETCVQDSLPVWRRCLDSAFLRDMAEGTLREDLFQGYIVDDSLYLREYARVFAWGMVYAKTSEEMRGYYSILGFVNEAEDSTRRQYLRKWNWSDEDIQRLPLRPENQAYVDCMISAVRSERNAATCVLAALPCMLSYAWIFRRMMADHPQVLRTFYGPFVADYTGDRYDRLEKIWMDFANRACADLTEDQKKRYLQLFHSCSEHELRFWEMSNRPRDDLPNR